MAEFRLETPRLILRDWRDEDWAPFLEGTNTPEGMRWLGGVMDAARQQWQRERLVAKLEEAEVQLENNRLEQELVLMAQRVDVAEELDRLEAHVKETYNILKKKEAVGRRLDFMMQEFNRESNTLASKSINADVTNSAIELKVLIEQMREQIQNIE